MFEYDLIVVGGGSGGLTVAAGASSLGAKVALIEKEVQPGGDCLHYGCVPSKTLIEEANKLHQAVTLGFRPDYDRYFKKVQQRVKDVIATIQEHDDVERFRKMGVDVIQGYGSFLTKNEVAINDGEKIVSGKRIVLATGSRPFIPDIPGLKEAGFFTNKTIFNIDELPGRLLVLGAGPIGIELAQAFSRLGSNVTVLQRSENILVKEDQDIIHFAENVLSEELHIHKEAHLLEVYIKEGNKVAAVQVGKEVITIQTDAILVAAGRVPNTDYLALDRIRVETDEKGYIKVNKQLQTSIPTVYAVGDVNGSYPFTHVAGMEGKLVVQNAVFGLRRKVDYSQTPWVTYSSPEIFHMGLTEQEANENGLSYKVYKMDLTEVDRFVTANSTAGFVKLVTDKKGKIIGAHAIGKGAGDWMQEVVAAVQFGKRIGDLSMVMHPYPNHAAAVQRTADLYWREKFFEGILPNLLKKYIKWFR
ncbi:pyridine nucleotide-disulfide oxidoreductase [Bacillus sp. LL01]|uniref:dihydrolipoyl dehydrogenase family protein n=1 Tax=Bacillus sp. LL01 TaxID=1665556 RepID=UPI00064D0C22|nr:NAD(P)/FAD-dependent oxidoreductase [Bacillus sp. LL01]KMJ59515.1 pyridine nucleotide-disulfide oxidoreductase [Bacillus sp. LL01]